jgi:transcriptional regulator with XRE-family HTH domain
VDRTYDDARRTELRTFLRSRRARLRPEDVGLPQGGPRRRASGLRREEVAALAGLSVTWYTLLENGRNDRISPDAIASVARALRLDADERAYLAALARVPPAPEATADAVPIANLRALIDDLAGTPAVVWNRRRDALAWNALFAAVFEYAETSTPGDRNGVRRIFLDPAGRRRWPEWDAAAKRAVAGLKWQFSHEPELVHELIAELRSDPVFVAYWDAGTSVHDWMTDNEGTVRVVTAGGASLLFRPTSLAPPDSSRDHVQVIAPADAATRAELARISSSRPSSRAPDTSL